MFYGEIFQTQTINGWLDSTQVKNFDPDSSVFINDMKWSLNKNEKWSKNQDSDDLLNNGNKWYRAYIKKVTSTSWEFCCMFCDSEE